MAPFENLRNRLPFGMGTPDTTDPHSNILGHTPPEPDPARVPPRVHQIPIGQSGRSNYYGLPSSDELNRMLVGAEGLRRFDEMYRTDPHVKRLVLMAWAPIVAGTWGLDPYGGDEATDLDREVADSVWWGLTKFMSPNWFEHLATLGPVLLRSGFTPFEQIWTTTTYQGKTLTLPRKLDLRLPRSVWKWYQDDFGELTHITQILPDRANVTIPATEIVYYRIAAEGDNWHGTSLLRSAYKPWYLKDKLERIDAVGQERKAVGVPVVYPPAGAQEAVKKQVEALLASLHTSEVAYLMMPGPKAGSRSGTGSIPEEEWLLDVIQFDSSSGPGIQESLQYHQRAIESSFAQDFMALGQHQVGARATAEVQEDPYLAAVGALLTTAIIPPQQRLIDRIVEQNWGSKVKGSPVLTCSLTENASLSEIATYVQQLAAAEALTPDPELEDYLREHAELPPIDKKYRDAREKAQLAGFEQAAAPPEPGPSVGDQASQAYEMEKAKAKGKADGSPINPKKPAKAGDSGKQLDQGVPDAKWFERLLSQDRLREAFDGCRDQIQASCGPAVLKAARQLAYSASEGMPLTATSGELADALTAHYQMLYALGQDTVAIELAKQRAALGRTLDAPGNTAAGGLGARLARARARGEHSARNIIGRITERLGRDQITGLKDPQTLQTGAEQAATAQLRLEALSNTAASINDGRADGAATASDVVGAYYTSVMDERTCQECERADDGTLLSPDDAVTLGPPNPLCAGQDFCRCALIWVLSNDPAALQAVA